MKYTYSTFNNDSYVIFKFDENLKVLTYVFEEMASSGRPIFKDFLEKVLSGESEFEEIYKDMCGMKIKKDYTLIYPAYELDNSDEVSIETKYLLELIDLWIKQNNL